MDVKVKICGITAQEEIEIVNELLPDYIGFVFAPSKRQVTSEQVLRLISRLDERIKKTGVFVEHNRDEVEYTADKCCLDVLQFHGRESPDYCKGFRQEVWKTFGIAKKGNLNNLYNYEVDGILLDTVIDGLTGGTGRTFDWGIADGLSKKVKLILAGGLNPDNVKDAIEKVRPFCVDVSSGVENNKGVKEFNRIRDFITAVRGEKGVI